MKWLLVFGFLFLSANVFAVDNFSSKNQITPLVAPQPSLFEVGKSPAQLWEICNTAQTCAIVYAGLDDTQKACMFKIKKWL